MSAYPHVQAAEDYAAGVVDGEIPNCRWVRLACQRYFDDLERADKGPSDEWPWVYDPDQAERVCRFIEKFPYSKGRWAAQKLNFKLEPWQCFVVCQVFGWVHHESGHRRFRTLFLLVPRKNGKSEFTAAVGLYMAAADGEFGAEVFCGARTEKQAHHVFRPAWIMAKQTPEFRDTYGVEVGGTLKNPRALHFSTDMSTFRPVIGNPGDGDSIHMGIVDELHEHRSADMLETFETGMGAREQPLLWIISTAGSDTSGPCHRMQVRMQQVLEGTLPNEQLFGMVYGLDADDDWTDPAMMAKANPNLDVSVFSFWLRQQVKEALADPAKQQAVKTKHFDIWGGAREPWMNMEKWKAAADPSLRMEDMKGCTRFSGVDLSSKKDLSCRCDLFLREEDDGEQHVYAFWSIYLPEERLHEPAGQTYQGWAIEGHITTTSGPVIDHKRIASEIKSSHEPLPITEIGVDPWNSTMLSVDLMEEGITVVEVSQVPRQLSEPMKWAEALVIAGRFHHQGNPAVTWMMGNVTAREDANENVFPRKEKPELKIDAATALLNAMNRALPYRGDTETGLNVYYL